MKLVVKDQHELINTVGVLRVSDPEFLPIHATDHNSTFVIERLAVDVDKEYFDINNLIEVSLVATPDEILRLAAEEDIHSIAVIYYKREYVFPLPSINHYVEFWRTLSASIPEVNVDEAIHIPLLRTPDRQLFRSTASVADPVVGLGCTPI